MASRFLQVRFLEESDRWAPRCRRARDAIDQRPFGREAPSDTMCRPWVAHIHRSVNCYGPLLCIAATIAPLAQIRAIEPPGHTVKIQTGGDIPDPLVVPEILNRPLLVGAAAVSPLAGA